jgi:hypothetical protein
VSCLSFIARVKTVSWAVLANVLLATSAASPSLALEDEEQLDWYNVSPAYAMGRGWTETEQPFDRLPAQARAIVRNAVWELSRHSAGIYVDVVTDASSLSARWTLTSERLAMPHMPATGVSGIDLYLHRRGRWHFVGVGRPNEYPTNIAQLVAGLESLETQYRLYFPLYNGVSSIEIGVPQGSSFRFTPIPSEKIAPVVVYGTSITQGGCASRPGMSYPAILGRRLNIPVINLGFSGNGKTEPEMARILSELKASAFVLDPLPNLFPEQVHERLPEFIDILRSCHPDTPIVLVESPLFPNMPFSPSTAERVNASNAHVRRIHKACIAKGDRQIYLVPACDFTTQSGEATVDGIHPTDVGFLHLATAVESCLHTALGLANSKPID